MSLASNGSGLGVVDAVSRAGETTSSAPIRPAVRTVETGRILRDAATLYAREWRHLASVAFAVYAGLALAAPLVTVVLGSYGAAFVPFFYLAGAFWLEGALVRAVADVRTLCDELTVREALERVWPKVNSLSAAGLVAAGGVYLAGSALVVPALFVLSGWIVALVVPLLVLPGVVLLMRWSLVVPAIMLEDAGVFRAFRRSPALVRGYRRKVFGVMAVAAAVLLTAWIATSLVVGLAGTWIGERALVTGVVSGAATLVAFSAATPFVALAWTLLYYELREAHRSRLPFTPTDLRVGDVLDVAWNVYKRGGERYFVLAAAVFAPLAPIYVGLVEAGAGELPVMLALTVFGAAMLEGAFRVELEEPRDLALRELLAALRPPRALLLEAALLGGAAFVAGTSVGALTEVARAAVAGEPQAAHVALALGLAFALVPAVALMLYGSLANATATHEGCGMRASVARSRELVAGHARGVVTALGATIALAVAVSLLAAAVFPPVPWPVVRSVLTVAVATVAAPYLALAWTLVYFQLRDMGETRPRLR